MQPRKLRLSAFCAKRSVNRSARNSWRRRRVAPRHKRKDFQLGAIRAGSRNGDLLNENAKRCSDIRFLARQYHANLGKGGKATLQVVVTTSAQRFPSVGDSRGSVAAVMAQNLRTHHDMEHRNSVPDRGARHRCLKGVGRMAVIQNESAAARDAVSDVCLSTQTSQKRFSQEIKQEFD